MVLTNAQRQARHRERLKAAVLNADTRGLRELLTAFFEEDRSRLKEWSFDADLSPADAAAWCMHDDGIEAAAKRTLEVIEDLDTPAADALRALLTRLR